MAERFDVGAVMNAPELRFVRVAERNMDVGGAERVGGDREALADGEETRRSLRVLLGPNVLQEEVVVEDDDGP